MTIDTLITMYLPKPLPWQPGESVAYMTRNATLEAFFEAWELADDARRDYQRREDALYDIKGQGPTELGQRVRLKAQIDHCEERITEAEDRMYALRDHLLDLQDDAELLALSQERVAV